jgi:intein/homing endonuclease
MPKQELDPLADLRSVKLPFDLDAVDEQCHECVRKQLKKYEKYVDENGKSVKGQFRSPCTGVPKHYIDPKYRSLFPSKEILEAAEEASDITKWAANNLKLPSGKPWVARWYQSQVLRCTSRRKVLRISRRCLVSNSKILMADGSWENIQDIHTEDIIATRNKKNQLVTKKVLNTFDNGIQEVYKIRLSNGMSVKCTSNHPLLAFEKTENGQCIRKVWKTIEEGLSVGTKVVVFKGYDKWGTSNNKDLCSFLGYMITDGYFGKSGQTPKFTNNNIRMVDEVRELTGRLFGYKGSIRPKGNGYDFHITDGNKRTANKFVEFLKENSLFEIKADRKFIPDIIYKYDKESQMALVNRMFSGDGNISYWKNGKYLATEINLCSISESLLKQVRLILLKVGVESYISKETRRIKNDTVDSILYKLRISRATSIENYFEHVGFVYGKEDTCEKVLSIAQSRKKRRRPGSIQFRYETIKSIERCEKSQTYDIEVEDHHNFITDGILVHNSGKTDSVCVEICYYLFTEPGIKILVAGPQKSHTEEIITRVRDFIKSNLALQRMVTRDVSAPWYEIKVSHGKHGTSRLRGFAAGTKGKDAAVGIKGQDADRIYLEEMDYIEETSIRKTILPILHTTPNTSLIGFSTPSGFQTPYYRLCEENPMYKEFHYTYKVIPHWKEIEAERASFTEDDWTHEYLAEWGSSETGVYKPEYIDRALEVYEYNTMPRSFTWRYCIGTDWNEKHGTEIVVLGYNKTSGRFKIVDAVLVPKSDFTQLSGIQKLLDMNRQWKPDFIYIDAGNGSTNYELLMKTASEQRRPDGDRDTAKLVNTLKKYDAGSSIPIKDPITNEDRKVPAKPFMVNASVRLFEQNQINISAADQILEKQLRNYIIDRYTPTKTPVYSLENPSVGDHRLDALNLAIVAFHLEFNDLHTVNVITDVAAVVDPRTGGSRGTSRQGLMEDRSDHIPEDRRLVENDSVQNLLQLVKPGRVDLGWSGSRMKTSRAGWDTDQEEQRRAQWLQKKRSRGRINRNRPTRTNI